MARSYSVTSAGQSAAEDRAHRMRFYFTSMALRLVCVASLFFVRSWFWAIVCIVGAVVLPYLAVMVGNAVGPTTDGSKPEAPSPAELMPPEQASDTSPRPSGVTIVIDADAHRRAESTSPAGTEPGAEAGAGPGPNGPDRPDGSQGTAS